MEQFYSLSEPEREEAILKKLIFCIQCDIEALDFTENGTVSEK